MAFSYNTMRWRRVARAARRRDGNRCYVGRLIGADCSGVLHAHHVRPAREFPELAYDLDNVITACASHHPVLEAFRRRLTADLAPARPTRCNHRHVYPGAREECEARMARQAATAAS